MSIRSLLLLTLSTVLLTTVIGCVRYDTTSGHYRRSPSYSPPHGTVYRYSPDIVLSFDNRWSAYVIDDWPNHYYHHGLFWRFHDHNWYYKRRWGDTWRHSQRDRRKPPKRLRQKHPRKKHR